MKSYVALLSVALVTGGFVLAWEHTADGKQVFLDKNCNMCHAVSTAEIEAKTRSQAMLGPDLATDARELTEERMVAYLKREADLEGKRHPRAFTGTQEELNALVTWIQQQQQEAE
jgi:mono/diheme cytochrome c family protein